MTHVNSFLIQIFCYSLYVSILSFFGSMCLRKHCVYKLRSALACAFCGSMCPSMCLSLGSMLRKCICSVTATRSGPCFEVVCWEGVLVKVAGLYDFVWSR